MDLGDKRKRVLAAHKLLIEESTTLEKFESARTLLKGINSKLDRLLDSTSKALSTAGKLQKGDVIELSAEHLPENTEEEKKRKRALLLFIKYWKQLQSEVDRIRTELEKLSGDKTPSTKEKLSALGRVMGFAKGAFGVITLLALVIVAIQLYLKKNKVQPTIERKVIEETVGPSEQALSYWVKEAKVEASLTRLRIVWAVHVHKEDAEIRRRREDVPATGATVVAELRSQSDTTHLSGVVGNDGWVRWEQTISPRETSLYIIDVKGELPWSETNKRSWQDRPAASYKPGL